MIFLYIDGACKGNPGPASIGVVIQNNYGVVIDMWGEYIGYATNNIAEYTALIKGLQRCIELGMDEVVVYSDSQLLVSQLTGKYKVRSKNLIEYYSEVMKLKTSFRSLEFQYIPREYNSRADSLANQALKIKGRYPP
jgi:ribonuclease HI